MNPLRFTLNMTLAAATFAASVLAASSADAFSRERRDAALDRPLGFDRSDSVDSAIPFLRDEDGRKVQVRGLGGTSLATALGNAISVQAGANSTVVVNAQQINKGNITANTRLSGNSERWLRNVILRDQQR